MEKVILINRYKNINEINQKFHRIYFGNEFCEKLYPNINEFLKISKYCEEDNKKISILTPHTSSKELPKIIKSLKIIDNLNKNYEIIINDFGILNIIKKLSLNANLVWGRLFQNHIKLGNNNLFLKEYKINRTEYDRIEDIDKKNKIDKTLYYPYVFITKTRYCVFSNLYSNENKGLIECRKECLKNLLKLNNENLIKPTILRGNSQFIKKNYTNIKYKEYNINRLVYQPNIPY